MHFPTRRIAPIVLATAVVIGSSVTVALAQTSKTTRTEELQGGRWISVDRNAEQPEIDPELVRVENLINSGYYSEASKRAVAWLLANKTSPIRDRGLFLNAEALYRYGDRVRSFYYLDELMDEYPESKLYYPALEKQYQIADDFLPSDTHRPYKSRFICLPIVGREEEAIEMMYRIQQRSPGSPLAEKALLRTADYYYADGQYDLAGDAYAAYAKSYPRSPLLPRVRLRGAYANLAQFRGPKFDATPAIDARAQLSEIQNLYPDLSAQENVQGLIDRIDREFARKLLLTGNFYVRTHRPDGAVYLYRSVINNYPNSPEAAQARTALATMPKWALEQPEPGRTQIGFPSATQPSASAQ
jgi:outer membrane assembly lipoprotein YfiO